MLMTFLKILILAIIQGACELLPVSSFAHVILAEKLMGPLGLIRGRRNYLHATSQQHRLPDCRRSHFQLQSAAAM
jgi:undecaprenyl pyrophosphate phosphatase UppP